MLTIYILTIFFSPGKDVKKYQWCTTRKPKGFFVHQVPKINIFSIFCFSQTNN